MKWTTVALGECVAELRGGASIKGEEFTDLGFPVLHKGTIREGGHLVFERDGKSHVPTQYAAAKPKAVVDSQFVVATFRNLVRTGETLGFMAPVPDERKFLLVQGAYGLKLHDSKLDKRFVSHLSNAWIFHKEVLKRMVGTTQVHIRNSEFLKIPIPLPPVLADRRRVMCAVSDLSADAGKLFGLPPHWIGDGVAEHVEEGGLEEGVELGEGLAALGPQGVRRIQNPRNPLLLGEGREGDLEDLQLRLVECLTLCCSVYETVILNRT